MKLSLKALPEIRARVGISLPEFDIEVVRRNTEKSPEWLHFGAGNIFRGFISSIAQKLLDRGDMSTGIIAADTFDYEIIDDIFKAHDNLTLNVSLGADGNVAKEVLASVCEALKADSSDKLQMSRFSAIASSPSLRMISFTITEKGYAVRTTSGELSDIVKSDISSGTESPKHAMSFVTALLVKRYKAGALPVALVSMDNCSQNGKKLKDAVMTIAAGWKENGFVDDGFISYISDETKVSFPWSMIDNITPRDRKSVV